MSDDETVHRLMPHSRRPYDFPVSRDWEDIDCRATGCIYNRSLKCGVPSLCEIGEDGRCKGFRASTQNVTKVDGD